MAWRLLLLGALSAVAGCGLDRTAIETVDGAVPDAPPALDAGTDSGGIDAGPTDGGPDAGPMDAGPFDAGPPDTGPPDAGPPDAGPPDAGPPDAGPPDAGPTARDAGVDAGPPDAGRPDAGPPDAGPPALRSCMAIYGALPSYTSCAETATDCTFYVNPSGNSSCDALCGGVGGTCSAAFNEGGTTGCTAGTSLTCASSNNDEVCVCSRIP